jgi:hypothetical protein
VLYWLYSSANGGRRSSEGAPKARRLLLLGLSVLILFVQLPLVPVLDPERSDEVIAGVVTLCNDDEKVFRFCPDIPSVVTSRRC